MHPSCPEYPPTKCSGAVGSPFFGTSVNSSLTVPSLLGRLSFFCLFGWLPSVAWPSVCWLASSVVGSALGGTAIIPAIVCVLGIGRVIPDALVAGFMVFIIHAHLPILFLARNGGLIIVCHLHPLNRIRKNATEEITRKSACKAPSRSRKLTKVMHEFTEKFGMAFANFLELGPHSQPKRKLIDISGECGHYLYLHTCSIFVFTNATPLLCTHE